MTALNHQDLITRTKAFSHYFRHIVEAHPQKIESLIEKISYPPNLQEVLDYLNNTSIPDTIVLNHVLRQSRQNLMLHLMARDLAKLADLREVMTTISSFAEITVKHALHFYKNQLSSKYGDPIDENGRLQDLIVVAMGKLGGGELNVSSDIDLIFVYPEDGETTGPQVISNQEFFEQLGRKLISALNELTADGFVFRVDMRLRPYGDSGPLVCSFAALEEYFISQGREWERYAWIKARPISGDQHDELQKIVKPFVFRKYLDFGAYESMRKLHVQIRQEVKRRDIHDNIKLGSGGIREIEFIAQVFQLIRGGRDPRLQARPTLTVLDELQTQKILPDKTISTLKEAYIFLRNLEHRLQYLDDQQTHTLPANPEDRNKIAASLGFNEYESFAKQLEDHRAAVSRHFEEIFSDHNEEQHPLSALWLNQADKQTTLLQLKRFKNPQEILERLQQTRNGLRYRSLPVANRERFDVLVPRLIELAQNTIQPDQTLIRALNLLEVISGRAAYLELLYQYPKSLEKITQVVTASSWAAEYVTRHPILLDELLVIHTSAAPDWKEFKLRLDQRLATHVSDIERQMDVLREAHHTQLFRLLMQDLAGQLKLEALSDHLSMLADIILETTLQLCWSYLNYKHRIEPKFAIIAYGKLGGKELGYASDLDLIFLYDDGASDAPEVYARLAQRINTWLTTLTPAGILFETDLRLRPNGQSGLLVSSIEAFHQYQFKEAWVWEHQALTRARFCAGDASIGEKFEAIRLEILQQQRDLKKLREDVVNMRQKMREAHSNKSNLFDVKHDHGGLIDIEFIVQYLVLAYSHQYKKLTGNKGNIALLRFAAELDLIPLDLAETVRNGYREYRRIQHQQRLDGVQLVRVSHERIKPIADAVLKLWQVVFVIK